MKLFIDTANIEEIKKAYSTGLIDGITTNPSLAAKEKIPFDKLVQQILKIFTRTTDVVNLETISTDAEGMIEEGINLSQLSRNVVVKVPCTTEGLIACQELTKKHIRVNVTLCFSPTQALLAAKSGAYFISPFIGRLEDQNEDGMHLVEEIKKIYENYRFPTKILVASVRSVQHITQAAMIGADCSTLPFTIFEKLVQHNLTDIGLKKFLDDWKQAKLKLK